MELLKRLCETDGVSGHEDCIVNLVRESLTGHADSITVDAMKNITAFRRGTADVDRPVVMLAGHIDEIGFLVYNIDSDGFVSLVPVGGWDPANIYGHTVRIHTRKHGTRIAVVNRRHELDPAKQKHTPAMQNVYLDLGLPGDRVREMVSRGDWVSMDSTFQELGDCFVAKAFDDRVGVYIMIEAVRRCSNPKIDLYAVGTSQEEVGLRGSAVAAQSIRPDIAVAIDITGSGDTPGYPERIRIAELGKGVAIKQMDSSVISSTSLVNYMRDLAEEKGIDHQMEILTRGGTDTQSMQRFGPGAHSICLSIPSRYGHSPVAVIHRHDVETAIELLVAFLDSLDGGTEF